MSHRTTSGPTDVSVGVDKPNAASRRPPARIAVVPGHPRPGPERGSMESRLERLPVLRVASINWKGHFKRLRLEPGGLVLEVPLSACLTRDDEVRLADGDAWVVTKNGHAKFLQPYVAPDIVKIGGEFREFVVKEITEPDEHASYQALADYHYRGKSIHGRTARLIVRSFVPGYPRVLGYIELATPFFTNKPRATVFDAPFECGCVSWERWDMETLRRHIHSVVRIARTVVSPEFRSAGLGQLLVKHAAAFASERWQVAGYTPCFMEISADMLKFVPFAERAGMRYAGETEGNLRRVAADMRYLINRFGEDRTGRTAFEKTSGILDQQIARMDRSIELMKREGLDVDEFVGQLRELSHTNILKDFAFFQGIVSLPKPHYIQGLCDAANRFLDKRLTTAAPSNGHAPPDLSVDPLENPIVFDRLSLGYRTQVRRTRHAHAVEQAFEISPDDVNARVLRELSAEIAPGEIVLVLGPSGSGKSSLLRLLGDAGSAQDGRYVEGHLRLPLNYRAGAFIPIRSRKALIEVIGEKDVWSALYLLGLAGLSEPVLYLKRFEELSRGQQYRAMLAKLMVSRSNVWIADEFCANLDAATAGLVADNVRRVAKRVGATVVAAAPHCETFIRALLPDKVILVSSNWDYSVLTGDDYISALDNRQYKKGSPQRLRVFAELLRAVKSGRTRGVFRKGRFAAKPGLLIMFDGSEQVPVRVVSSITKRLSAVTDGDGRSLGYHGAHELTEAIRALHPNTAPEHLVTLLTFDRLSGEVTDTRERNLT